MRHGSSGPETNVCVQNGTQTHHSLMHLSRHFHTSGHRSQVDYYSKYPELCLLKDKTAGSVITSMKSMFARHGIPDQVVADNMPFSSKSFRQFARDWGFAVCTSSFSTHSVMG